MKDHNRFDLRMTADERRAIPAFRRCAGTQQHGIARMARHPHATRGTLTQQYRLGKAIKHSGYGAHGEKQRFVQTSAVPAVFAIVEPRFSG